jgi:hypothetical protein
MPSAAATPAVPVTDVVSFALEIPGPRDVAVKLYCEWQCSQMEHTTIKEASRLQSYTPLTVDIAC